MTDPLKPKRAITFGDIPRPPKSKQSQSKERIEIHLRYEGPDVDDGTMSVQDIVPVLQGFAGAYGKLAAVDDPQTTHRIRITSVRQGSADIVFEAWRMLGEHVDSLTGASIAVGGAYWIVRKIAGVISLKKHIKKHPFKERVGQNNTIIVTNSENVTIEVPYEHFELFKSGTIDSDLNKLASSLSEGRIDAAELEARSADGIALRERITADERPYFATIDIAVTSTAQTWLVAKLNSLTKSTNSGYLWLSDGTRVFYRYQGDNPIALHGIFGTYNGPVRILCSAQMDESFKVISVDVLEIERAQAALFPDERVLDAED